MVESVTAGATARAVIFSSMLLWSLVPGSAHPCSVSDTKGTIVAPSSGPVPVDTRVRASATGIYAEVIDATLIDTGGAAWVMEPAAGSGGAFGAFAPPAELPEGSYVMRVTFGGGTFGAYQTFSVDSSPVEFAGDGGELLLEGVPDFIGSHPSTMSLPYYDCSGNSYTVATLLAAWDIPIAPSAGWLAEVRNRVSGGIVAWQELSTSEVTRFVVEAQPGGDADEVCFTLNLYDFRHQQIWTDDYPCEEVPDLEPTPAADSPTPVPEEETAGCGCTTLVPVGATPVQAVWPVLLLAAALLGARRR